MASSPSDTMKSRPSLMNSGKREAVQTDRRRKIGFMPRKNCDPAPTPVDLGPSSNECPKCGTEMEPIETGVGGPSLEHLHLCPGCYLVMWSDQNGFHVRQGVPMKAGGNSRSEPGWLVGEPKEC